MVAKNFSTIYIYISVLCVQIMRICRHIRTRVGPTSGVVTYGSHLATHMALGLLFLGGGRYTLSNSPNAVAALIISLFPKFPTHSNDNRFVTCIDIIYDFI